MLATVTSAPSDVDDLRLVTTKMLLTPTIKSVTETFRIQHLSPTSMQSWIFYTQGAMKMIFRLKSIFISSKLFQLNLLKVS